MELKLWTVVRFPAGVWSGGGLPSSPDYEGCEVYRIPSESLAKATKKAQAVRARLVKKQDSFPTQESPYVAEWP